MLRPRPRGTSLLAGIWLLAIFAAIALAGSSAQSGRRGQAQDAGLEPVAVQVGATRPQAQTPWAQPVSQVGAASTLAAEPPIPRLHAPPCKVELFRDLSFLLRDFSYVPPADCPGPWAKVVLQLDLTGPRPENSSTASIKVVFSQFGIPLFKGAPQVHDQQSVWRLERDLTDYTSLLMHEQTGYTDYYWDNTAYGFDEPTITGTATLLFYPATANRPAPRVPDMVRREQPLPRNIERVYLEVIVQADRFWFTCVPTSVASAYPALISVFAPGDWSRSVFGSPVHGCRGGAYVELEVLVDGQRAGLVPVFPWLPSDVHDQFINTVDLPVPSVQAINFVPYRVDLTPFAGVLSDGAEHSVQVVPVNGEDNASIPVDIEGTLLLYLDKGSVQVSGAVVRNTLAGQPAAPTIENTLGVGDDVLEGSIITALTRKFVIEGYVDTSRGRIRSQVRQTSRFRNVQQFRLDGLTFPDLFGYEQNVNLHSTVHRQSRRYLGSTLLSEDDSRSAYPLQFNYRSSGRIFVADEGDFVGLDSVVFSTVQRRRLVGDQYRFGTGWYHTRLEDKFSGSHTIEGYPVQNSNWKSRRSYTFNDSHGSCYQKKLTTEDGLLADVDIGAGCPKHTNKIVWYARPDGSPSSMGWAEQP